MQGLKKIPLRVLGYHIRKNGWTIRKPTLLTVAVANTEAKGMALGLRLKFQSPPLRKH